MRSGNFSISFRRIPIKANCSERSSTYRRDGDFVTSNSSFGLRAYDNPALYLTRRMRARTGRITPQSFRYQRRPPSRRLMVIAYLSPMGISNEQGWMTVCPIGSALKAKGKSSARSGDAYWRFVQVCCTAGEDDCSVGQRRIS